MSNQQEQSTTVPGSAPKPEGREGQTSGELQREMSKYIWRERYDSRSGRWRKYRLGNDIQEDVRQEGGA